MKNQYKPLSVSLAEWCDTTDEHFADAIDMEYRTTR